MAEKKFTDQMRDMCDNWNLSKDSALLEHLQKMSENVIRESEGVLDMVKEVEFDVNKTAISVASCRNSLQALSDTQFIENKIEEIEEVENTSESIEARGTHSRLEDSDIPQSSADTIRKSILAGIQVIEENFEVIPIPKNDSDTEDTSDDEEVILKARNQFMSRPTPHLIGSTDFFRDNTVGILEVSSQDQSEDEMPSPQTPSPPNEVPLESQNTEPSPTTTSLSYPQPHLYSPVETNSTPASFHDQLSAKLHSVAHNDPEITHRVIGKVGPPQLFASSGSTSEDESSSLFDSHTPPTSTSILPQPEPMLSTTSNIHVQQPSQSENIQNSIIIPKKVIDKDATASILNEMLSKKILANNSTKSDNAPNLSTKSNNEPTMSTTPKADSESTKSGPSGIFKDNDDVIHPKPPKQIQSSQKPFKSSLAKSLFESSSDEDEPIPNWIPNNSRNQGKLFDSDEDHVQENENPNNGDKVLPAKLPSSVTNNPNIEINVAPVLDKGNRDTSEQDQIPTINKYKNNLTKVLPDISHAKPLRKQSLNDNTNKSLEDNNHTKEPEQMNKRDLEKSERKPMVKAKVKSIFDDSDDENVEEVKTAKTEPQEINVISKPVPKSIPNQPKKKIVSLFDDDSDDDIIEPSVPQKTIQTKPEVAKRSEDEVASREDKVTNSSVAVNNDDIFAEKHVASLNRTLVNSNSMSSNTLTKVSNPIVQTTTPKNDDIFDFNSADRNKSKPNKSVVSLFSDSDSEDDLFAIPKKSTNHKTNMTDPTKSKLNSENVTKSNNDTSSNLFDETKIKANTLMSSIIENKTPGINNDSNEPVVKTPSNMSNESKSKAPEVITNLNAHKTPESLINSIEKSSTTNSSSDLFSEDTDNFESPEIITSLSVEHNVEVPLPPSKNNLDGSANKLPKENTSVRKEGTHLNNNSESESVNNEEIEKKPNVEKGGNELEKDIKAPKKSPNAKDELDLFKDDKKESLGNRRIELFNSQDSDNSDDDLWGNVPKSKSLENSNNVKNTEYTHENTVSESISSMSDKALKVTDEKSTTDEALEIEDNKREAKVEVLNDKVSADHIECINNPITTEEHGSPNIGKIKKSLNLFGNIGSKAENIEEDKGKSNVPSSKVHSLVNSYSLSSESEPSSPLFPEDKSVRSVKVTPEAKIITKTDKDNPDGLVSSIVRKPEKLPSHMKLNVNLAGLLPPGGAITKKTIDSLRRDGGAQEKEKTPDEKEILLPTPSESTDVSPQSDLTSPESSSSFLPSLTKGRAKIPTKRKPPTKKGSLMSSSGDTNKNTSMMDSIDGTGEKILTVNDDLQSNATNSQPKNSILNEDSISNKKVKEDSVTESNILASNNVSKSTKEAVPATTNETASKMSVRPFEQDQKKVSFLDNSDDEDDIFRDISIKSDTKKVPQINQNSSVSKTAEINPTLTETKTTNEAVSETILTKKEEESTLKVSKNVDTLEILKPLNEDQSNESNIKNTNNINNVSDPAEGRKKLFTNANKMKNTNFLFNDDDDDDEDDLFGPTNKTQKSGTINSINKVTFKTEVTKSEINSEKLLDSAIKINKQSEISIERNEPVKQAKIGHEKREENSNENETNSTQNTKAKSVANTSNPDMNTVLNTKSIVNTQPTKNMSARKSTLFGDDDNDEDLFGSLNKSKTKDNHNNNNNKVESKTNKFFSDNQSDDDDDLFKSVSKGVSSANKKVSTSAKKPSQNPPQDSLHDPLSKF